MISIIFIINIILLLLLLITTITINYIISLPSSLIISYPYHHR
jgi:hypothetical protein